MIIMEDLRMGDLQYLVSNEISIDQYTSKIDDDNITVAFYVNEMDAAEELKDFIEKYYFMEIRDIEISDSMTENNQYILFVEFERNEVFVDTIIDMVDSLQKITNQKDWYFISFDKKKGKLTSDNLKKSIRLSKLRETNNSQQELNDKSSVSETLNPIVINKDGYNITFNPIKYISKKELEKYIAESSTINKRNDYDITLLENMYPMYEILTTDNNIFLISDDSILMME